MPRTPAIENTYNLATHSSQTPYTTQLCTTSVSPNEHLEASKIRFSGTHSGWVSEAERDAADRATMNSFRLGISDLLLPPAKEERDSFLEKLREKEAPHGRGAKQPPEGE